LQLEGIVLVDLCVSDFETHFDEGPDGLWEGLTRAGQYTIDALRLNRPHLVQLRQLIRKIGDSLVGNSS
jgi:hypothetical protein